MTAFLDIIQKFLIPEIRGIIEKSVKADNSLTNQTLGFFGWGRDKELSEKKKDIGYELLPKIENMEDAGSDAETLQAIVSLLENAKTTAKKLSAEKYYGEGKFGPRMQKAIDFINEAYEKLEQARLLDIPMDKDPLNQFSYHCAYYLVQKIDDTRNASLVDYYTQHPQISSIKKLSEEKEILVLTALNECKESLDVLNKEHPSYEEQRKKRVIETIDQVTIKNKKLCSSHGIQWEVPVSLSIFAALQVSLPTLHPDSGFLETCMTAALEEISAPTKTDVKALAL